jgi:ABC-type antimicrobial peptide transport system permease subunit
LGIVLASTFFAGINIGADSAAWQALSQQLSNVSVDISVIPGSYIIQSGTIFIQPFGRSALSAKNVSDVVDAISSVQGITHVEAVSTYYMGLNSVEGLNFTRSDSLIGVSGRSLVYNTSGLGENDTYVWAGSPDAGMIHVGDVLTVNVAAGVFQQGSGVNSTMQPPLSFLVKLRIAGFVNLNEQGLSLALGLTQYNELQYSSPTNLLITNWNKTFPKLLDAMFSLPSGYIDPFSTTFSVFVDRSSLISAWDVSGSANRLAAITAQIGYKVLPFGLYAQDNLATSLDNFQSSSVALRFTFVIAALPVFFVAWYVGSTVSDVSFDLRRREIGLLMTKGFSRRQLLWMFLLEAGLIGLLGGLLGVALSFALTPLFVGAAGGQSLGALLLEPDVVVLTVVFAVMVTFLSVFRSARKASDMAAVDALKEYVYVEEAKPYRQVLPWAALILGSFKMVVFLLGINLQSQMTQVAGASPNVLVFLLSLTVAVIDFGLNYVGPFLFFWGLTKILISGSLKFQEITAGTVKFLGDLAKLATKNVRRKPARVAAVAFLIAFIIGFSFQAVGTVASQQDLITRQAKLAVGSDISLMLSSPTNASQVINTVRNNVSQIQSITTEYALTSNQTSSSVFPSYQPSEPSYELQFWAVTPKTWLSTAYYEDDMFSGGSAEKDFEAMSSNNYTIILDRNVANALDKKVGDIVTETFVGSAGGQTVQLTVVGLFGLESTQTGQYWSYVPEGLYAQLEESVRSSASATILIKLQGGADSKAVAVKIRGLDIIGVSSVSSLAEQIETLQNGSALGGSLNIMDLGAFFMVGAASVGTALVTLASLTERKREASVMSVRGLSFKQLLIMLLTESLAVVTFAVVLGTVGGLIVLRGIVASNSAFNVSLSAVSLSSSFVISPSSLTIPLEMRMVFPLGAILTLFVSFVLVFASTIIPTVLMAKRYCSRLERVVREV